MIKRSSKIEIVSEITDVGSVESIHTNEATYALDGQKRLWVRKRVDRTGWEELLAEAIAYQLGRAIGAPVPDAGLFLDPDGRSWLSRCIEPTARHWDPSLVDSIENLPELGNALALAAIIHDADRHARNLLVEEVPGHGQVRLWAIDFGSALAGWPDDFAKCGDAVPDVRNLASRVPLERVTDGAMIAANVAERLSLDAVNEFVRVAFEIAEAAPTSAYGAALVNRLAIAPTLVRRYLAQLESLT